MGVSSLEDDILPLLTVFSLVQDLIDKSMIEGVNLGPQCCLLMEYAVTHIVSYGRQETIFFMSQEREVIAGPLPFLEDLLWEWVTIQERFLRLSNGADALWWHNERTSIGALAGAVWRAGGVVLEEYSTEKLHQSRRGSASRAVGRGDMDFLLGGRKFVVEAKQCWPRLGVLKPIQRVKKALAAARTDVKRADAPREYLRLAVVFAAPGCLKVDSLDLQLANWLHAAKSLRKCACAWVFPEKGRGIHWPQSRRTYPGAAVFVRLVGRRNLP